jgi:hypothetical protein
MPDRVSLAALLDSHVALSAAEAVALIVQLARSPQTGRPRPVQLDASHVWLDRTGSVTLAPGILPRPGEFAELLHGLLSPIEDVPHGLRAFVDRASAHEAAAAIPSLSALAAALAPFQPIDPAAAVGALVTRYTAPHAIVTRTSAPAPVPVPVPAPVPASAPAVVATPKAAEVALQSPLPAAAQPDRDPAAWRPAPRHVAAALAAALLAAVLGGVVARWRDADRLAPHVPASVASMASEDGAPAFDLSSDAVPPGPVPMASAPAPAPLPVTRARVTSPTPAMAPRPAPLVDRRDAEADAVFSPSFAADGTAIFFHAESTGGSALKRADAGGSELRVASIVDDGARNYHVQLSPDGTHVAFDSDRDGVRGVYVADAQGRGVRRVSGPGYAAVPTWSPDGRQLAFLRAEPDRPAVWNLWVQDRASGDETRVTAFRHGQVWGGAWFADGRRMAYSHEDRLTIQDLATGRRREIVSPLPGRLVRTPAVSPDGRSIVFQVFRDGVWLLDVERGTMRRLLADASAEEFAWSPDGRRFAYHSRRSGGWNLWTMAPSP